MEIHERLKEVREAQGRTLQETADLIGVQKGQVYRWEHGKQEMGIFKLKELCILYNVSADYILGLSNKKSRG